MNDHESLDHEKQQRKKKGSVFIEQGVAIRGAMIGATVTAFVSWNSGRYSRIGTFFRRWRFVRQFVQRKKPPKIPLITSYNYPSLNTVVNNFICYSGQPGIGKSHHFQHLCSSQSQIRPALYLAFKAIGQQPFFTSDISRQLSFGDQSVDIMAEIINTICKIHNINTYPYWFILKYFCGHAIFGVNYLLLSLSTIDANAYIFLLLINFISQLYYTYFTYPLIKQCWRKTCPLIILDDLNKIQQMNKFTQIVRFLRLIEQGMCNIMMVSSDEQTWTMLRSESGMKDRLRLKQLKYDHKQTQQNLINYIEGNYNKFISYVDVHPAYTQQIVQSLIQRLIGRKQMTLRRFISVMKLNDEEQYHNLLQVLQKSKQKQVNNVSQSELSNQTFTLVSQFQKILLESQMKTMLANLKSIKRSLNNLTQQEFIFSLQELIMKGKLLSDNKIASLLKLYSIVRDLRSQYIVNGRYIYQILMMAVQQYRKDLHQYHDSGRVGNFNTERNNQ